MPACPTRILIVDDHSSFRQAARLLLADRGFTVVGEADSARTALEAATAWAPDGVLLDVQLGHESGLDVAQALMQDHPAVAVLLVSAHELDAGPERLRACGARGFVLKSELADTDLSVFWPE